MEPSLLVGIASGLAVFIVIIYIVCQPKKKVNPEIEKFEKDIERRGFLLVEGHYTRSSVFIPDTAEFLKFAKRSRVGTIFKAYRYIDEKHIYFYIVDGQIIRTSIKLKVKA